jgi:hypothetical protein
MPIMAMRTHNRFIKHDENNNLCENIGKEIY